MTLVDCIADWLRWAYSVISRWTRAPSLCSNSRSVCNSRHQSVDLLHRGAGHPLQQRADIVGHHLAFGFRRPAQRGDVPANELANFSFHRTLRRLVELSTALSV